MSIGQAVINITNLRLRTFIGFQQEEKNKQQDVVINIEIHYSAKKACLNDNVDAALDYKKITKSVIGFVEDNHFLLLEKMVSDVLLICSEHTSVTFAKVTIDKPHALRFADSVSLSLEYHNQNALIE